MKNIDELYKQLDKITEQIQNFSDVDELAKLWDKEDELRAKIEAYENK